MTDYLLDTSVASILDPTRGLLTAEFQAWLIVREPRLHISAVTIMETTQGIGKLRKAEHHSRADALEVWLDGLIADFGERVLSIDTALARRAGALSAQAFGIGRHPGVADIMIGATALSYDLLLLTRNVRHFEPLGINVADPTIELPH